ncbi:kinase-like domain-containing protein, partial [Mycena galopus ATCC 62051]
TWAPRPPPEDVYERLEDFFPEHDLDRPVIETISEGSPTRGTAEQTLAHVPSTPAKVRGKKSIRLVAQERKNIIGRTSRVEGLTAIQPKRSTKLWGSKVEEVDTNLPESPSTSEGPSASMFKWVRGELIGQGTYGRVYLALNATTGEMIAVKQVEISHTVSENDSRQVKAVQALKLESETLNLLDHPNIVQYLGFEERPTNLSIFMEYVPGGSIRSCLLKHGKFDEDVTKSFTLQILAGLEYLHSKGILHRDLKSDNVLVEMTGECKISNFEMSERTDDRNKAHGLPMESGVFWMAPEVINSEKKGYSFQIDIWSIGCVVLEMWTGRRPWLEDEVVAVMFKLFQSKFLPPVPDGVVLTPLADDFRKKCLTINPEERPTAAELRRHSYLTLSPGWQFDGFAANPSPTL